MERIRTIIRSGIRNINLVAPDRRCTRQFRSEIQKSSFKTLHLDEDCLRKEDASWCDIVVYSTRDEDLVTDHCLLSRVIYPNSIPGDVAFSLYRELGELDFRPLSVKTVMKKYPLGTFYRTREVISSYCSSGLFSPVGTDQGKTVLVPYYYSGDNPQVLACRHLLSLGYSLSIRNSVIHCELGNTCVNVGFDIDEVNFSHLPGRKILISPRSPIVNFSQIRTYTLSQFLDTKMYI